MSIDEEPREEQKAPPSVIVAIVFLFVGLTIFLVSENIFWLILGFAIATTIRLIALFLGANWKEKDLPK